jgi:hypothetical protein
MKDDKQLEVQPSIEFCIEFSLANCSTFNQKGKRKEKGPKAQRSIFYILLES